MAKLKQKVARVVRDVRLGSLNKKEGRAENRYERKYAEADAFTTPEEKERVARGQVNIPEGKVDYSNPEDTLHLRSASETVQKEFAQKKLDESKAKIEKKRGNVERRYQRRINS